VAETAQLGLIRAWALIMLVVIFLFDAARVFFWYIGWWPAGL